MKKKICSMLLTMSILASTIAGCGSAAGSGSAADSIDNEAVPASDNAAVEDAGEITIYYPGDETERFSEFLQNEFAEKIYNDIGLKVNMIFVPWDQYWTKKEIMLAANETVDLYWDGLANLSLIVNKKQAQPLDELIEEYGQDMLKVLPMSQVEGGLVDGQIYGIPSAYGPSSGIYQLVCVREDILEAVGMDKIETPDDLMTFAEKAKEQFPEMNGPADIIFKPLTRYFQDHQLTWIGTDVFTVLDEETGKVSSYYESDAFKKVAKFNEEMYRKGLYADELTTNYNEKDSRMQTGLYLWVEASIGKDREIINAVQQNAPEAELKTYILAPEKDKYISTSGGEVLCIPYSAANKEGAMKFINWIYSSPENYRFAIYGVEGKDYQMVDGRVEKLTQEDFFYEWMFRNKNYQLFDQTVSDEYIETYEHWDDDAKISSAQGFIFNNENVVEIETAITEVTASDFAPLRSGFVSFDDHYDEAVAKLKAAGIDEYVAEVQRQYDEFRASKEGK
ncbi:extracellular solute-binding protein [Butyrivibrio sp. MC2013]|uniref:extracellular solute-binding protein n=1 Tax=Butyrivibrio sp. MC2013 TaxID=1280686 RepID=UPI00040D6061|nr:extracellular solute-binding protein [Butyrivibrio sp. MC2013]